MYLSDLTKNQQAKVVRVGCERALACRLADMGLRKGAEITVKPDAPLGDPMHLMVLGYDFTLRKKDAKHIVVEVL